MNFYHQRKDQSICLCQTLHFQTLLGHHQLSKRFILEASIPNNLMKTAMKILLDLDSIDWEGASILLVCSCRVTIIEC